MIISRKSTAKRLSGFSLIELIVTLSVAAFAITAIIISFRPVGKSMLLSKTARDASILAQDVMGEILSREFVDSNQPAFFGPEEGAGNRRLFNDVDDYDGMRMSPPTTIEGAVISNFSGLSVSVAVANVKAGEFNAPTPQPDGSTAFKRISVTVRGNGIIVSNVAVAGECD